MTSKDKIIPSYFCKWEIEILEEFNKDDCIEDLLYFIKDDKSLKEEFLSNLADSLFTFKFNIKNKSFSDCNAFPKGRGIQ